MTKNKTHWTKSPWTRSIVTALFSFLLPIGYDYYREKPMLSTICDIFNWLGSCIISILKFNIKVWWLVLFLLILFLVIFLIDKINKSNEKPHFYSYVEDRLQLWKWSWRWKFSEYKGAWIIDKLQAHCPDCDTPMMKYSNSYRYWYECPRCSYISNERESEDPIKIEHIILDNINRKEKANNK